MRELVDDAPNQYKDKRHQDSSLGFRIRIAAYIGPVASPGTLYNDNSNYVHDNRFT